MKGGLAKEGKTCVFKSNESTHKLKKKKKKKKKNKNELSSFLGKIR